MDRQDHPPQAEPGGQSGTAGWQEEFEEFEAALAQHCDLGVLTQPARKKLKAAFGASVGKVVKKDKKKWRKNGNHTPYAEYVVNTCAKDLAKALKTEKGKITPKVLRKHAVDLTENKWMDECPVPAGPNGPALLALGPSCADLLVFFEDGSGAISRRQL